MGDSRTKSDELNLLHTDPPRAYALLTVETKDLQSRTFSGFATTPEVDRQNHSLDPFGASFANPLPLLYEHKTDQPIGRVTLFPATPEGIRYEATIPEIHEPGALKTRIDTAWQSIKAGLITGVSIGYRILDAERLKDGIVRLLKTEIVELSLVTIPANRAATVLNVKALDLAATGRTSPRAGGIPIHGTTKMQTLQEQIHGAENSRAAKSAAMVALMATANEAGTTLDESQTDEFGTLDREVKSLDDHLSRLRRLEQLQIGAATPVPRDVKGDAAVVVRGGAATNDGVPFVQVKTNLPKGTAFVRACMALAAGRGEHSRAIAFAERWKDSTPEVALFLKAAVAPGTSTDAAWAGPLTHIQNVTAEFMELLRPATILGKIPGLRQVPFNASIPVQTAGGSYGWVGQGAPKSVTKLGFSSTTLGVAKVAGIIVITKELAMLSDPSAETVIRADMIAGIAQFLDQQFVDPAVAPVVGVSPGSITNGTVAIASSGNILKDLQALVSTFQAANMALAGVTLIMSETNAFTLGMVRTANGDPMFPGMGATGGTISGVTIVTSNVVGSNVILLQPRYILYADDGGVTIDVSQEASIQMDSAPMNPTDATTVFTSLWQSNLVGLRAERFINWNRAVLAAVKYVSGAVYVPAATGGLDVTPSDTNGRTRTARATE